jgi:hypothetical protein
MTWLGNAPSGFIFHGTNDNAIIGAAELAGDASGILGFTVVTAIQGFDVTPNAPSDGQVLVYNSTASQYVPSGISAAVAPHTLLSTTHSDTVVNAVTRGSLIYGNATPAWDELVLGTSEFVLYSNGTDATYVRLGAVTPFSLGTFAAPTVTFTGDLNTGFSAQVADELVGSAAGSGLMTLDGTNRRTKWVGGQVYYTSIGGTRTLTAADNIVLVNAAPATITLPATPALGQYYCIKDSGGNASGVNRIIIAGNGNNIDGNTEIEIRISYGSFTLVYNGAQWNVL